jgi:hemerythrin superfamily protein
VDAFGNRRARAQRLRTLSAVQRSTQRNPTDADPTYRPHFVFDPRQPPAAIQDAIQLLRADHRKVQDLFDQFEKARGEDRKAELARKICMELKVHAQIEEEIFYPAARAALKEPDLIDEATVEHASAKELIAQIEQSQAGDELFDAKVTVLGEYIKHHVKEEHNEIFPKLKKTKLDLKGLGQQLAARKETLMAEG